MDKTKEIIAALISCFVMSSCSSRMEVVEESLDFDYGKLGEQAVKESLIPIRPGIPGERSFWNENAQQFMFAPAFDFKMIDGAFNYEFIATTADGKKYKFQSKNQWDSISEIWKDIPAGMVELVVNGLDDYGKVIGQAGFRNFFRLSSFRGQYNVKNKNYRKSAEQAIKYLFNQSYFQNWITKSSPDTSYKLYCYPAKIIGAVVESMIMYSKLSSTYSTEAITIAKNAADYLIGISEPENASLAFFPPTYTGEEKTAKDYKNQFMSIYPAEAALNYLDLFDVTGNSGYYNAAVNIAGTYKKIQLSSGTWKLKLWRNGNPVKDNDCIPVVIIKLFERLRDQYSVKGFDDAGKKAFDWIIDNPVKTFNWTGQYEDIDPGGKYRNLTEHEACSFAIHLFNMVGKNPEYLSIAEELLRFAEDQFVVWEKPVPDSYSRVKEWIIPCALEQYDYYVPIDASVSKLMETYMAAYKATGKKLYMAKAVEFANSMTVAQLEDTGRYPTYWENNERRTSNEGWINCTSYDVKVMLLTDAFLNKNLKKTSNKNLEIN